MESTGTREPETKSSRTAALTTFAEISALFVVVSAAVYVLGLLALWTTISPYTGRTVAWDVVSQAPRTLVAGHGLRLMLVSASTLLYLVFAWFTLIVALWIFFWLTRQVLTIEKRWIRWLLVSLLFLAYPLYRSFSSQVEVDVATFLANLTGLTGSPINNPSAPYWTTALNVFGAFVATVAIVSALRWGESMESFFPKTVNWRRIVTGFIAFFVFTSASAVISVANSKPSLPTVSVSVTDSTQNIEGLLLPHPPGSGSRYILDKENDVVEIPDDKVNEVRYR